MNNGKWIWLNSLECEDVYCEFITSVFGSLNKQYLIKIASSSYYVLFVNDEVVSFTHCSDFKTFKYYNEINISAYIKEGNNNIKIQVWHEGLDTQRAFKENPGLIFEILEDNNVINYSSKNTLCRINKKYANKKKYITTQLGYSFCYDANADPSEYNPSVEVNKFCTLEKRPIKELILLDRTNFVINKVDDGYLIDMQKEMAGFLELDFFAKEKERIIIAFGEHIIDGNVRQIIGTRDFSVEYIAKQGKNNYINYFRRLGCRYLHIITKQTLEINFIGIRDEMYPVSVNDFDWHDDFINNVYKTSIRTLQLCMHEHYEDCPWREQCLYTMDSTNQIRCGYYCFENGNIEYVRYNLLLISKSIREDGLLAICAPSGLDYPIPSFTLAYLIEVSEYLDRTNDLAFKKEVSKTINTIVRTFMNKIDESGLISEFKAPYWDFYEWQPHCCGDVDQTTGKYNGILNCLFVYAVTLARKHFDIKVDLESIKFAIKNKLYSDGIIYLYENHLRSSQLSCALGILIGVSNQNTADIIINDKTLIPSTLSMKSFVYDALLKENFNLYKCFILNEIKDNYLCMLKDGATSFYETILGAEDFCGAGSLCHGWSAIPIIYYNRILKEGK